MHTVTSDDLMRNVAVMTIEHRASAGILSTQDLEEGFIFQGQRVPLINPQRGIFKPRQMTYLLSVRTVYPRPGNRIWYDDQRQAHTQIHSANELVEYSFMRGGADKAENQWLKNAWINLIPVIYFLGVAPGRYTPVYPTYIAEWSATDECVKLAFGPPELAQSKVAAPTAPERRYGLSLVRRRLHQATFREAVLSAYGNRCAISGLPEPRLLDAAHIVRDSDEQLGQPIVTNGLPMSKMHHAAYDADLIGIDPDYRVHLSDRLLSINDGPMLEGLKKAEGQLLILPRRSVDRPDRERLAARFETFKAA